MRKIALALSTALALSNCSPEHLSVNPSPDTKIVRENERAGIADLRKLVEESESEEAWAYISPTVEDGWMYSISIPEWHDIGLGTETGKEYSSVTLDVDEVKKFGSSYRSVHLWHIHPQPVIKTFLADIPKGYTPEQFEKRITIDGAIPSPDDLAMAVYFSCALNLPQTRHDRYLLASYYGVTEYKPLYDRLVNVCRSDSDAVLSFKAQLLGLASEMSYDPEKMQRQITEAVNSKTSAELFRDKYLTITFWPYEALPKDLK